MWGGDTSSIRAYVKNAQSISKGAMCPTGSSTYGYVIHHNVGGVACDTYFNNYQSNRTPRPSCKSLGGAHTQNIIKSNRTQHVQSLEVAYSISQWICELKL